MATMVVARINELLGGPARDNDEGVPILFMNEDDAQDVHGKIAHAMRAIGFTGPTLDEAIAGAFRVALNIIERERAMDIKRRHALRVV